jgi:hypothetical protein
MFDGCDVVWCIIVLMKLTSKVGRDATLMYVAEIIKVGR